MLFYKKTGLIKRAQEGTWGVPNDQIWDNLSSKTNIDDNRL